MDEADCIKRNMFETLKHRELIMIVKEDYGFSIHKWLAGGVCPQSTYDTPHEAGARVLQLLRITDPVSPQDWPEVAQIGGNGRDLPPPPRSMNGN